MTTVPFVNSLTRTVAVARELLRETGQYTARLQVGPIAEPMSDEDRDRLNTFMIDAMALDLPMTRIDTGAGVTAIAFITREDA